MDLCNLVSYNRTVIGVLRRSLCTAILGAAVTPLFYSIAYKPAIAELASTAATDVGMHGLLASQLYYHSVLLPVYVHCEPVVDFFITKQTSLHPFDFC